MTPTLSIEAGATTLGVALRAVGVRLYLETCFPLDPGEVTPSEGWCFRAARLLAAALNDDAPVASFRPMEGEFVTDATLAAGRTYDSDHGWVSGPGCGVIDITADQFGLPAVVFRRAGAPNWSAQDVDRYGSADDADLLAGWRASKATWLAKAADLLRGAGLPPGWPPCPAPAVSASLGRHEVSGLMHHGIGRVGRLQKGAVLRLQREPENAYDRRAVAVVALGAGGPERVGYVPRASNGQLAALMDAGAEPVAVVERFTPGFGDAPPRLAVDVVTRHPAAPDAPVTLYPRSGLHGGEPIRFPSMAALVGAANAGFLKPSFWDMRGLDLRFAQFLRDDFGNMPDFTLCDLSGTRLRHATLSDALLLGAVLPGQAATGATFDGCCLDLADLSHADLGGARMNETRMVGAVLRGTALGDASLHNGTLDLADLRGADLRGAGISSVSLKGADLSGAALPPSPDGWRASLADAVLDGQPESWLDAQREQGPAAAEAHARLQELRESGDMRATLALTRQVITDLGFERATDVAARGALAAAREAGLPAWEALAMVSAAVAASGAGGTLMLRAPAAAAVEPVLAAMEPAALAALLARTEAHLECAHAAAPTPMMGEAAAVAARDLEEGRRAIRRVLATLDATAAPGP